MEPETRDAGSRDYAALEAMLSTSEGPAPELEPEDLTRSFSHTLREVEDLHKEMEQELTLAEAERKLEEEYSQLLTQLGTDLFQVFDQEVVEVHDLDADADAGIDSTDSTEHPHSSTDDGGAEPPLNILCIDGGGIKGLVPALILQELQGKCFGGKPIPEVFDLVCGTSTGGIIALGTCVAKRDIGEMVEVYRDRAEEIFATQTAKYLATWTAIVGGTAVVVGGAAAVVGGVAATAAVVPVAAHTAAVGFGGLAGTAGAGGSFISTTLGFTELPSQYSAEGLKGILQEKTLTENHAAARHEMDRYQRLDSPTGPGRTPKVFVVTAKKAIADEKGEKGPLRKYLLKNYTQKGKYDGSSDCRVWQAGMATGAAPTIFDAMKLRVEGKTQTFIDGGVIANNPCLLAVMEAHRLWPKRKIGCVLSIGCTAVSTAGGGPGNRSTPSGVFQIIDEYVQQMSDPEPVHRDKMLPGWGLNSESERGGRATDEGEWKFLTEDALYVRLQPKAAKKVKLQTTETADLKFLEDTTRDFLDEPATQETLGELARHLELAGPRPGPEAEAEPEPEPEPDLSGQTIDCEIQIGKQPRVEAGKTYYQVLWTEQSGVKHSVWRRYSEFDAVREKIRKTGSHPDIKQLHFPEKTKRKSNGNDPHVVDARLVALQQWLQELLMAKRLVPDAGGSDAQQILFEFLTKDSDGSVTPRGGLGSAPAMPAPRPAGAGASSVALRVDPKQDACSIPEDILAELMDIGISDLRVTTKAPGLRPFSSVAFDYTIHFTSSKPGTYRFSDESGDTYSCKCFRNSGHNVMYSSKSPIIIEASFAP